MERLATISNLPVEMFMVGSISVASNEAGLTEKRWQELSDDMRKGIDTDIWEEFLEDSKASLREKDLTKSVIYAAVADETFIEKYTKEMATKVKIDPIFGEYLEKRRFSVLDYYDVILHLVTGHSLKTEKCEMYAIIKRLNEARNAIMHMGTLPSSWNEEQLNKLEDDISNLEEVFKLDTNFKLAYYHIKSK